jgi:nucleotide-binding universal stress UspA family protein
MYRTIVLAYDGHPSGAAALEQAAELARICDAPLHLLGVAATSGGMSLAESVAGQDAWAAQEAACRKQVGEAAGRLRDEGLEVTEALRSGEPAQQIAEYARECGADLVVLGHTGKGVVARWMQGSVGARLLDRLPCSLLVAMETPSPA